MVINKNSWHYRLYDRIDPALEYNQPKSLCGYFWSFVGHCILALLVLLVGSLAVAGLPISLYSWLHNGSTSAFHFAMVYAGIAAVIGLIFCFFLVKEIIGEWLSENPPEGQESFMRIAFIALRSWKNKVCPLLTYEEQK